jgi:hypothetical protein
MKSDCASPTPPGCFEPPAISPLQLCVSALNFAAPRSSAEAKRYLKGMRVIKSRFATSTCAACGEAIDPGVSIAREEPRNTRGGWAHLRCLVESQKAQQQKTPPKRKRQAQGQPQGVELRSGRRAQASAVEV